MIYHLYSRLITGASGPVAAEGRRGNSEGSGAAALRWLRKANVMTNGSSIVGGSLCCELHYVSEKGMATTMGQNIHVQN